MVIDKTLTCRDCGQHFVFTAGEQEFYQSRGLLNEPGRCPDCRQARKNRGGSTSGGSSSGGHNSGGYDRPARQLYSATCAECGQEARLPFEPHTDKPVYCSDCFQAQRSFSTGYRSARY